MWLSDWLTTDEATSAGLQTSERFSQPITRFNSSTSFAEAENNEVCSSATRRSYLNDSNKSHLGF